MLEACCMPVIVGLSAEMHLSENVNIGRPSTAGARAGGIFESFCYRCSDTPGRTCVRGIEPHLGRTLRSGPVSSVAVADTMVEMWHLPKNPREAKNFVHVVPRTYVL